jgi:hypothetical protein
MVVKSEEGCLGSLFNITILLGSILAVVVLAPKLGLVAKVISQASSIWKGYSSRAGLQACFS